MVIDSPLRNTMAKPAWAEKINKEINITVHVNTRNTLKLDIDFHPHISLQINYAAVQHMSRLEKVQPVENYHKADHLFTLMFLNRCTLNRG